MSRLKKKLPYIFLGVLLVALVLLIIVPGSGTKDRRPDWRMSFKKRDRIPYGTFVAWENLRTQFPAARITTESAEPSLWTNLSETDKNQLLIIIAPNFKPDESEMNALLRFIKNGNDVFISTVSAPFYLEQAVRCDIFYSVQGYEFGPMMPPDSMQLSLSVPLGSGAKKFAYPGHGMDLWFHSFDTARSRILGTNEAGKADFIGMKAGAGNLYLHLAPIAFSNYFLLHKNNMEYYDRIFSMMSKKANTVVWDEYFITKRDSPPEPQKNWLTVLMNLENAEGKKPFKTALLVLLSLLAVYALSEMRRKQRPIPVMKKPANESLDFVKTIGRLYHDKGDHANLCRKMTAYFLEHVRSRYKLNTQHLNEDFIRDLSYKSGVDEKLVVSIVKQIQQMHGAVRVSAQQMAYYHDLLEKFYKYS